MWWELLPNVLDDSEMDGCYLKLKLPMLTFLIIMMGDRNFHRTLLEVKCFNLSENFCSGHSAWELISFSSKQFRSECSQLRRTRIPGQSESRINGSAVLTSEQDQAGAWWWSSIAPASGLAFFLGHVWSCASRRRWLCNLWLTIYVWYLLNDWPNFSGPLVHFCNPWCITNSEYLEDKNWVAKQIEDQLSSVSDLSDKIVPRQVADAVLSIHMHETRTGYKARLLKQVVGVYKLFLGAHHLMWSER